MQRSTPLSGAIAAQGIFFLPKYWAGKGSLVTGIIRNLWKYTCNEKEGN